MYVLPGVYIDIISWPNTQEHTRKEELKTKRRVSVLPPIQHNTRDEADLEQDLRLVHNPVNIHPKVSGYRYGTRRT